jgi:hypothetical protein
MNVPDNPKAAIARAAKSRRLNASETILFESIDGMSPVVTEQGTDINLSRGEAQPQVELIDGAFLCKCMDEATKTGVENDRQISRVADTR